VNFIRYRGSTGLIFLADREVIGKVVDSGSGRNIGYVR